MIIARGLLVLVKVGFAIGSIIFCFLIFPSWYDVCALVYGIIIDVVPALDSLNTLFLQIFPYLFIFLMGLGLFIVGSRLLDKVTSQDSEGE